MFSFVPCPSERVGVSSSEEVEDPMRHSPRCKLVRGWAPGGAGSNGPAGCALNSSVSGSSQVKCSLASRVPADCRHNLAAACNSGQGI